MRAPRQRRIFFLVVPLLAPVVALLTLEAVLRLAGVGTPSAATDPGRGFLPFESLFREEDGALVLETPPHDLPFMNLKQFNAQRIPTPKPPDEVRLVVLGGSVVYGWPYDDRLSPPRLVEAGLRAAAPDRTWRVINLGAPGWGSSRLRLLGDDVARLEADVVVVMTGHNEGIEAELAQEIVAEREARLRLLSRLARRSHLVTWMITHLPSLDALTGGQDPERRREVLESIAARRDLLVTRYADNLAAIVRRQQEGGARVLVATMASNLRSCPPFGPSPDVLSGSRPELSNVFDRALAQLESGDPRGALATLGPLSAELPDDPNVMFLLARAREAAGEDADEAYRAALALDATIARAFPALNVVATRVAERTDAVLVDLVSAMDAASTHGVPGDDLFRDNCHPNRAGSRVLTAALGDGLARVGLLPDDATDRFVAGVDAYLAGVAIPAELELEALKFELFYFMVMNPDPARERETRRRIAELDPEGRVELP